MLFGKSHLNSLLDVGADGISDFCAKHLDAAQLTKHFDRADPMTRKEFCKYLEVGESTVTGWLKEDRIPLMAKEAIVLRLAMPLLRALRDTDCEPRIVKSQDGYQICEFSKDGRGEITGSVIALGVTNIQRARLMLSGLQAAGLRERALRLLESRCDTFGFFDSYFRSDWTLTPDEAAIRQENIDLSLEIGATLREGRDTVSQRKLLQLLRRYAKQHEHAARILEETGEEDLAQECLQFRDAIEEFLDDLFDYLGARADIDTDLAVTGKVAG
ncbi:hypothetical protein [Lamprocystis purpurea]|jgi:hypothetical protein|uniref:hypothetical protein n=1 Tax=Lamprocystis purpurea TaxID=61598 RepID=UPI00035F7FD1|nr:hypothetical protein [Lamprocystis purpurea]